MRHLGRLGFGRLTLLLTLGAVVAFALTGGGKMFSPGPLNGEARGRSLGGVRSHAEIGGNCSACHVAPWNGDTMADRCLNCHTDIGQQLADHRPMHGQLTEGKRCRSCHTEHKGPHAALTSMDRFDHDCAAFKLTGKHTSLECSSCHVNKIYKDTPQTCVGCHAEPKVHKGQFGTNCSQCHSTSTWQAGPFLANFD